MKDSLKNEVQNTVEAWIYRKTGDQNARLTDDEYTLVFSIYTLAGLLERIMK